MSYLYGDSTAFPYDVDYIELSRHAIDCSMQLLSAQHAIVSALSREEALNQLRHVDLRRLGTMAQAIESALAPHLNADSESATRVALRTLQCAQASLEEERVEAEKKASAAASHAQHVIRRASESANRALEAFLAHHDLPETDLGLTLSCQGEQGYTGEIALRSPFGVSATFALRMTGEHGWSRPRRVGELAPNFEIHVPQTSGWIAKRREMARVKLDRLFVQSVRTAGAEFELAIRKTPNGGAGYRLSADVRGKREVRLTPLNEYGLADAAASLVLDAEDGTRVLELAQQVMETVRDLTAQRGSMRSVVFDEQPLEPLEWPEQVAHRLLAQLAPVVLEISRRSGAPGELVLRRDVGGGRREEIYVTKAELWERLLVLAPERRTAFGALGLSQPALRAASESPAPTPSGPGNFPAASLYEVAAPATMVSVGSA